MELFNTDDVVEGNINALIYGKAGVGKTSLAGTTGERVFLIAAEHGTLPLAGMGIDCCRVTGLNDLRQAYGHAKSEGYRWVFMDSISEVAEVCLAHLMAEGQQSSKFDPRQAYGGTQDAVMGVLRTYIAGPWNFVAFAKLAMVEDIDGNLRGPSFPGRKLGALVPYLFDLVMPLRAKRVEGETVRWLQTQPDGVWEAKVRHRPDIVVPMALPPNLAVVRDTVQGTRPCDDNKATDETEANEEES
ncbi:MAG: AAA family ATPase [Actinomycetia bacterium]|jgi:hypothetical protein|nr:AAA family ATPase [Actinomycetes bacterium]